MRQEKVFFAISLFSFAFALLDAVNIFCNGFTTASTISIIINSVFCLIGIISNRKLVYIWIGINLIATSVLGLPINYFYIILLFFINNCRKRIKILFALYWTISGVHELIKPGTEYLLQQLVMSAGAFFLFISNKSNSHFILHLTPDEEYILSELMQGKQQKEIAKWNKNTVSKKLKQARERNNILSNAELLLLYREKEGLLPHNAD